MSSNVSNSSLALTPLSAGDLIDRAVRFYRQNFWTFVWIVAPPILLGTLISIAWGFIGRVLLNVGTTGEMEAVSIFYQGLGGLLIIFLQVVLMITVMGGASRNFVRHLLFGEQITFKETYKNVFSRFFGLICASAIIVFLLSIIGTILFYFGLLVIFLLMAGFLFVFSSIPQLLYVIGFIVITVSLFAVGWVFFLVASRLAYTPQIMLVEGQGMFSAMGRSSSLAGKNVMRIYALFIFSFLATISALLLFYVPLNLYVYLNGLDFSLFDPDTIPLWYIVVNQVIWQGSLILLAPILMIGLCLLYVDERVRHEGYDLELMAAKNLGEIPNAPTEYANPLQPALAKEVLMKPNEAVDSSIFGLK